jgi:hypothetical protein
MPSSRKTRRKADRKAKKVAARVKKIQKKRQSKKHKDHSNALEEFVKNDLKLEDTEMHVVEIGIDGISLPIKRCHENCETIMKNYPRPENIEILTCWIIHTAADIVRDLKSLVKCGKITQKQFNRFPLPGENDFEAEFHSILRFKHDEKLVDPTKDVNPSRKIRLIVLETRLNITDFRQYVKVSPENICTDAWKKLTPIKTESPDFFQLLNRMNFIKTFKAQGKTVLLM